LTIFVQTEALIEKSLGSGHQPIPATVFTIYNGFGEVPSDIPVPTDMKGSSSKLLTQIGSDRKFVFETTLISFALNVNCEIPC
jgi:hypothetical protein